MQNFLKMKALQRGSRGRIDVVVMQKAKILWKEKAGEKIFSQTEKHEDNPPPQNIKLWLHPLVIVVSTQV